MSLNIWMDRLWHIHTMEQYPAIGGKGRLMYTHTDESQNVMLNERSQRQKK